jgi:Spy/CpxP family protein refolding chaperone
MALSQERREGFMVAQRSFLHDLAEQRFEVERLRHELRRELLSEQPDEEAVERHLSELATRSSAIEEAFAKHVLSTRAMLDPQQEARYLEFLRRMPELRGPGGPPGMRPGGRRPFAPGEGPGERRRDRSQGEPPPRP